MDIKAVPKASPTPLPELETYLQPFSGVFHHRSSRQSCERYITGLLTDLPRKNCDTMAAALAGTTTERLQYLLTDAAWDPLVLDELRVQRMLAVSPGGRILALDDTGLPKQGHASVGVAQQYCGILGKVANSQNVVTAEYIADAPTTSTPFHWPVTAQVYLPESWVTDADRRKKAHVPDAIPAHTKLNIALQLIDRACQWGVPFAFVLADAGYGRNADFLKGLEERRLLYGCAVECTFGVRRPEEVARLQQAPPPAKAGRKGRPRKAHPAPLSSAQAIIGSLPHDQWQVISWREGSHGTMRKQFVALRMRLACGERSPHS